MKAKTPPQTPPQQKPIKIQDLDPGLTNFQLHFEIEEVLTRHGDTLSCRIVDDTGIVLAYFNRYAGKMDKGGVYLMTNLKCCLVDGRVRVEMSQGTVVSKEPDIIGFKDKSNDVSKRVFDPKSQQNQTKPVQPQSKPSVPVPAPVDQPKIIPNEPQKRANPLIIPLTKEEALQQLKILQQLQQRHKLRHPKDKQKTKGHTQYKQAKKQQEKQEKEKLGRKKSEIKHGTDHKEKNQSKTSQQKVEYKLKEQHKDHEKQKQKLKEKEREKHTQKDKGKEKQKQKNKYKEKSGEKQTRVTKAKSMMYKQKKEDTKQHKDENAQKKTHKNGNTGNDQGRDSKHINDSQKKVNKYKPKEEEKKPEPKIQTNQTEAPQQSQQIKEVKPEDPPIQQPQPQPETKAENPQAVIQQPEPETKPENAQEPSKDADKRPTGCINIIQVLQHLTNHVNLRAWITQKTKPSSTTSTSQQNSSQIDRLIADSTGAIWIKTNKMHLQPKQVYEIDNLEVCKDEEDKVYLREIEISEATRLEIGISYNLRDVNSRQ